MEQEGATKERSDEMAPPAGRLRRLDLASEGENRKVEGHLCADNRMLLMRLLSTCGKEDDPAGLGVGGQCCG